MSGNEEDKALVKLLKNALVDTGMKAAESLPLIGPAVGVIKGLVENSKDLYDAINRQKLYDFYMGIYKLDDDKEKCVTNESLGVIVRKLLQDDEATKTNFYSRFIVNVASSKYNENERTELIIILSKLTSFELELARKYYINSKYEIDNLGFIVEQLANISDTSDGFELKAIANLKANGLVYESKINRTLPYQYNITTNTLDSLVKLIYFENELKPESIGASYDSRESVDVFIFNAFHTKANREKYEMGLNEGADEKIRKYQENLLHITKLLDENDITFKIGDNYSFQKFRNNTKTYMFIDGDVNEFFSGDEIYKDLSAKKLIITMSGSVRLDFFNDDDTKYILYVKNDENDTKLITTMHELIDGQ